MPGHSPFAIRHSLFRAFTLIEMVVVVAIVLILVVLVVPATSTLWSQRKVADAENTVQGFLMTARAKAIQSESGKHGLLFFVDGEGVQQVVPIKQVNANDLATRGLLGLEPTDPNYVSILENYRITLANVYEIAEGRSGTLPAPFRAAPRYIIEVDDTQPDYKRFSDAEIGNNTFESLATGTNNAQRHRNFFTMIFSTGGELLVGEEVLIMGRNEVQPSQSLGDVTGLAVGDDGTSPPSVTEYYAKDQGPDNPRPVPISSFALPVPLLIVDGNNVAINFPSVDGLLIHDDEALNELAADKEKRAYLERAGRPMYVNRRSGAVIHGPVGEVQ